MRTDEGGATVEDYAYNLINANRTFRVNPDGSTTPVVNLTVQSQKYGVVYTWTMLASQWDSDQGKPNAMVKTEQVNVICGSEHVQDFRTETDQGPSQQLYNYAVITVGTDDGAVTNDFRVRMDHIGDSSTLTKIDQVWNQIAEVIGG